ncbi:DNA-directed RNA polymerase subunit beta [Lactiplantibacillus garii]|uniref:DNA-directed RNA polymerase subunit beta n=1 Tax=Lactiplantibacillus garii TaxID=2306423 RepID=A0A3R8J7X9_9LACO|nr:DNA-directed RNA polymerase subunit beta [Lactiplantibacillus garii]RRK10836.1 DNA-directed RNA polymerase subunit beta [Lactiplantibacillus garii]
MENIVPREKWLYDDRGMMKWMGWLLSDHSAYLESAARQRAGAPIEPQLSRQTINERLQTAWQSVNVIELQVNTLVNNHYPPLLTGVIVGFNAGTLAVQTGDGVIKTVGVANVRWVALVATEKWWDHDDPL